MSKPIHAGLTGTTEECVQHFNRVSHGANHACQIYLKWAPETNHRTARRWFVTLQLPVAERLLKLQLFLEEQGYHLTELENMSADLRTVRTAIAKGILSIEKFKERLGYNGHSSAFEVLYGKTRPIGVHRERFELLAAEFKSKMHRPEARAPEMPMTSPAQVATRQVHGKQVVIDAIVPLIQALYPLTQAVVSDQFTARDREEIRRRVGDDRVFHLKNALAKLCGERARETL